MKDIRKQIKQLIDSETDMELLLNIYMVLLMRKKRSCRIMDCCKGQRWLN